jgi:hypothetical protein
MFVLVAVEECWTLTDIYRPPKQGYLLFANGTITCLKMYGPVMN